MTNEEKQLLLKDLCVRVPYGIIVKQDDGFSQTIDKVVSIYTDSIGTSVHLNTLRHIGFPLEEVKPYLRPISSMTDSEIDKLFDILHIDKDGNDEDWIKINDVVGIKFFFPTGKWVENVAEAYDYLNSIHIDYRGLIEKGLALKASEGMY